MPSFSKLGAIAGLSAALLTPCRAAANGRYPEANQLVQATAPNVIVVRATFGLVVTEDAGGSWRWVCEQAMGFTDVFDPPIAVLGSDTIIAGLQTTLSRSPDKGCSWQLDSQVFSGKYVIDVTARRDVATEALAVTTTAVGGALESFVAKTTDSGATWNVTGDFLGPDFRAVTIELAPSDPDRIYVSGLLEPSYDPVVAVSDDGGQTWVRRTNLSLEGTPFISAIDPGDPDRLYARVPGNDVDSLYVSTDGAVSFQKVAERPGRMLGFALSPDGTRLAIGGPSFGIESADAFALELTPRSQISARCLTWSGSTLFVCGDEALDGFTVASSADEGATVTPLFHLGDLELATCETNASTCGPYWQDVLSLLGVDPSTSAGGTTSVTSGGGDDTAQDDGCSCKSGASLPARSAPPAIAAFAALILLSRRSRRRSS